MAETPAHKPQGVGNDIYGPARLALALELRTSLDAAGYAWFLDAGTLLGAYRDGRLIPHDDDFDLAVHRAPFGGEPDLRALQSALALPAPYAARRVTSYASKLEVFDRTSRRFELPASYGGADYHVVTVDLQVVSDACDGVAYMHDMLAHVRVPRDALFPLGRIVCEGHEFPAPRDPGRYLEALYGYLGADARYDPEARRYVAPEAAVLGAPRRG